MDPEGKTQLTHAEWFNQTKAFFTPAGLLRLIGVRIALSFATLAMGISFFVIGSALSSLVLRLAPYWQPAYAVVSKVTGEGDPTQFQPPPSLPWWHVASLAFRVLVFLALAGVGIWLFVIMGGFLGQNLIWRIFFWRGSAPA